ncbi:alpha/beta fold hydrolase [Roseomonas sp. GC11]|uniref:alpha/beta fold hydrolase n=1 Tax=Roseomonas sp. GC11 TaxID=2950546 RepID=UPI002109C52B|nr:alpha/beta fold hydrolase [Roseomonas sp. GC11]MCQ4158403.1 alpha/beta fold hydrolase [Roseomonas sp. GC11]
MQLRAITLGEGEGPPLILLHGLFGQAQNFASVQKMLAARRRVIALDLRNHGHSPHDARMDYPAMAADVAETLAGEGPFHLLGHSMGGKVAMTLALTQPGRVASLIVADIAPVTYPPAFRPYAEAMQALPLSPGLTRREADAALAAAVPGPGVRGFLLQNLRLDANPPAWRIGLDAIATALPVIEDAPPLPEGARFGGPVLVLGGENSDYIRPEHRVLFLGLFPAARFATLKGAGHWLHAEKPEAFAAAVEGFLK